MQIGFNLPTSGPLSSPESMTRIAQQGEALGYDYLTLTDHVVLPNLRVPGYPYSETGEFFGEGPERRHEQLTAAAFIAAKTTRVRLVLAVMVVPHRPAVLAAKMLSTIDVLSGGRLVVGIGAGWLQAEFDAVVGPPFAARGRVTDEYLSAFRTLWTAEVPHFEGNWVKYDGIYFEPKPVQKPHPPIWVGGESGPSLRRAARFGDAWYPIGSNCQAASRHAAAVSCRDRPAAPVDRRSRTRAGARRPHLPRQAVRRSRTGKGFRRRAAVIFRQYHRHHRRFASLARSRGRRRRYRFRALQPRGFGLRNESV
jgi:probable F420-dependent oxidoreductase